MERVMIFIDGDNFYHGAKSYAPGCRLSQLDYHALSVLVADGRKLIRTYYYTAAITPDGTEKSQRLAANQQRFLSRLHKTNYLEVRLGRMTKRGEGYMQKGVDTKIAIDMLTMAHRDLYDVAVLISCDSDLEEAVQSVKNMAKHVELGVLSTMKAHYLKNACDKCVLLDDYFNQIAAKL